MSSIGLSCFAEAKHGLRTSNTTLPSFAEINDGRSSFPDAKHNLAILVALQDFLCSKHCRPVDLSLPANIAAKDEEGVTVSRHCTPVNLSFSETLDQGMDVALPSLPFGRHCEPYHDNLSQEANLEI